MTTASLAKHLSANKSLSKHVSASKALDVMEGGGKISKGAIPAEYVSGNEERPLKFTDANGNSYNYFQDPMWKAAVFVLLLEGLERFAYYTIQPEFPSFLTNPAFGALTQSEASAMISTSSALSYVWPLVGGALGDGFLGAYKGIMCFATIYLAALVLFAIMGSTSLYMPWMNPLFFYGLLPMGMGGVKSLIAVMGANQFHPVLHESEISSFYLKFYMVINLCAFASTGVNAYVNTVGNDKWKPFSIPAVAFAVGMLFVILAGKRLVKRKPLGSVTVEVLKVGGRAVTTCPPSLDAQRASRGGKVADDFVNDTWRVAGLVPFLFIVLCFFNVTYWYMSSYLIYQGLEMNPTWGIESNVLNSGINPLCIIGFGALLDFVVWPALRKRNLEPGYMNKFMLGCLCGVSAMLYQVFLEYTIKSDTWGPDRTQLVSIFAQVPTYALIGLGEILVNPTAYDLAYKIAPESFKGMANGLSVFMVGCVPNLIASAIAATTTSWQQDANGCTSRFDTECDSGLVDPNGEQVWDYSSTNMQNLYWIGATFAALGLVVIQFVGKPLLNRLLPSAAAEEESTTEAEAETEAVTCTV